MFDKMWFKNPYRQQFLTKNELNVFLASNFKIYRMMTTIWYHVVLDKTMISRLQSAFESQLEVLHDAIINSYIEDAPLSQIDDVKLVISKFMTWILDISINENSVHYLIHSSVVLDHPYEIFEDSLLELSCKFIKRLCELVYNKYKVGELLSILGIYSKIIHNLGPLRLKK